MDRFKLFEGQQLARSREILTGRDKRIVRKTEDETLSNSNVLQDDNELFFNVEAGEIWSFDVRVRLAVKASSDFKYAFTIPTGATGEFTRFFDQDAFVSLTTGSTLTTTFNHDTTINLTGIIINGSAAGKVQFQWSQNTAVSENTTVYANSYIIATKLN